MKKRVDFELKITGRVTSRYVWVEKRNVTLRNGKGYSMLEPRTKEYDVVFLAKGAKTATAEIKVKQADKELAKKKFTIGARGVKSDHVCIKVESKS